MRELTYNLSRGRTEIVVGKGSLERVGDLPEDTLFVFPERIHELVDSFTRPGFSNFHVISDGEGGKTLESVMEIVRKMHSLGFRRNSTVVSVGGGSTSDATGMAASIYMRGINYVSIPTTLLSMVDAALGGKNAINYGGVKNLIGSFYSPKLTIVDTGFLRNAPENIISDGLGEVAKYALILDHELFDNLMSENPASILGDQGRLEGVVARCIQDKMAVVERDEFDVLGERAILNFGHTMGHAIEGALDFSVGHGKAVAMGILLELEIGMRKGLTDEGVFKSAVSLLGRLGLPDSIDRKLISGISKEMSTLILSDKKASRSTIKMPVPESVGKAKVSDIEIEYISDYLEEFN